MPEKKNSKDGDSKSKGGKSAKGKKSSAGRLPILTIVEAAAALVAFALLCLVVHWLAALSIASALFVFLDAAINHVNRIKPSSDESRLGLLVWSLAGFVPFAGVAAYVAMRKKLASAPAAKITTSMEAVETVKKRMRMVPVPVAVVVGVIALVIGWSCRLGPFTIEFGTDLTRGLRIEGTNPDNTYYVGTVCVKLSSSRPLEGYADLDWRLFRGGTDGAVHRSTVRVQEGSDKTLWVWKMRVSQPGRYTLEVVDNTGKVVKRGYFRALQKLR